MRPIHQVLSLLLPCVAFAQDPERVPKELFGVALDGIYQLEEDGSHTLPVARVTGIIRTPGHSAHVYFEPLQKDPMFPYVEYPGDRNEYLRTSYRLQLLPVITDDIDTREDLSAITEFRVVGIYWSRAADGRGRDSDNYAWAIRLCESTANDIGLEPDVEDTHNWFICTFAGPEREGKVSRGFLRGSPIVGPERELRIDNERGEAISLENGNAIAEWLVLGFE
jgi:hypothetical protein